MSVTWGLSLRHKLPLLVAGLTATGLVVAATLAYLDMREYSRTTAEARLQSVSLELARLSAVSLPGRYATEDAFARSPLVQAALRGGPLDTVALTAQLADFPVGADAGLPVMLISTEGDRPISAGTLPEGIDPLPDPPLKAERAYGYVRPVGDRMLYWYTIPVRGSGDEPIGWIAQRRRIGNPALGGAIESFIGSGIRVAIGQVGDSMWVDFGGKAERGPPETFPADRPFTFAHADGTERLAVATNMATTPWIFLLQTPMSEVLARSSDFLRRAMGVGAALILVMALVGWKVGSRLTDPLQQLAAVADNVAAGNYESRVQAKGGDEIARLGVAFNTMAEQVAQSAEALRHRLDEARALALSLQDAKTSAERSREEAELASKAKSEFLATMSHEIRTPINAVVGYTELLKAGIPDPPTEQQRSYLQRIDRSSQLLLALVNDVLDFSHIESGRMRMQMGVGSPAAAAHEAVAALEPDAHAKGVRLTQRGASNMKYWGDQQRVKQILLNLVSNAVKFTPEGGSVTVSYGLDPHGPPNGSEETEWLRIDVADTGIGIDQPQMEKLFEPFVQGNPTLTREHGGIGLGLSISRRLASMMGGQITVESRRGEGSRFTLWLTTAHAENGRGDPVHGDRGPLTVGA